MSFFFLIPGNLFSGLRVRRVEDVCRRNRQQIFGVARRRLEAEPESSRSLAFLAAHVPHVTVVGKTFARGLGAVVRDRGGLGASLRSGMLDRQKSVNDAVAA